MIGGTSAAWAEAGGALPARAAELGSGAGPAGQDWPLASALPPLAALPTAPACARGHVRAVSHQWGLPDLADTAEIGRERAGHERRSGIGAIRARDRPGHDAGRTSVAHRLNKSGSFMIWVPKAPKYTILGTQIKELVRWTPRRSAAGGRRRAAEWLSR